MTAELSDSCAELSDTSFPSLLLQMFLNNLPQIVGWGDVAVETFNGTLGSS
jgi:hypothetical protein